MSTVESEENEADVCLLTGSVFGVVLDWSLILRRFGVVPSHHDYHV